MRAEPRSRLMLRHLATQRSLLLGPDRECSAESSLNFASFKQAMSSKLCLLQHFHPPITPHQWIVGPQLRVFEIPPAVNQA